MLLSPNETIFGSGLKELLILKKNVQNKSAAVRDVSRKTNKVLVVTHKRQQAN